MSGGHGGHPISGGLKGPHRGMSHAHIIFSGREISERPKSEFSAEKPSFRKCPELAPMRTDIPNKWAKKRFSGIRLGKPSDAAHA